jgi:hypothetical protein
VSSWTGKRQASLRDVKRQRFGGKAWSREGCDVCGKECLPTARPPRSNLLPGPRPAAHGCRLPLAAPQPPTLTTGDLPLNQMSLAAGRPAALARRLPLATYGIPELPQPPSPTHRRSAPQPDGACRWTPGSTGRAIAAGRFGVTEVPRPRTLTTGHQALKQVALAAGRWAGGSSGPPLAAGRSTSCQSHSNQGHANGNARITLRGR